MIYLLCFLTLFLLGRGALRILYRTPLIKDFTHADSMLTGGMVIIGLAEAAHMGAVVLGRSFSDCVKLFLMGYVFLLIVAGVLVVIESCLKKKDKAFSKESERLRIKRAMTATSNPTERRIIFLLFGLMVLIQLLFIVTEQKVYSVGDMTVETVNSMLTTDTIYQVNPMTGESYTLGMPMRLKILCLPTLYAVLCDIFGLSAVQVAWNVVPVLTLLGSYLAFYTVAKVLFPMEDRRRGIFMIFVALLLWVGDSVYGMDGFAVQYAGFRGVSIRMAILLPYTFGLILRRKWKLVILCIFAEACIVWTLYGMGMCLAVTIGMLFVGIVQQKKMKNNNIHQQSEEGVL